MKEYLAETAINKAIDSIPSVYGKGKYFSHKELGFEAKGYDAKSGCPSHYIDHGIEFAALANIERVKIKRLSADGEKQYGYSYHHKMNSGETFLILQNRGYLSRNNEYLGEILQVEFSHKGFRRLYTFSVTGVFHFNPDNFKRPEHVYTEKIYRTIDLYRKRKKTGKKFDKFYKRKISGIIF